MVDDKQHRLIEWWLKREKVTDDEMKRLLANDRLASLSGMIAAASNCAERSRFICQWWGKAHFELGRMRGSTRRA